MATVTTRRICRAMARPFGDFCAKDATHGSIFGDRCAEHAALLVERLQYDDTLISLFAGRGLTQAEAKKRVWVLQ